CVPRARWPSCASRQDCRGLCAVAQGTARAALPAGLRTRSEPRRIRLEPLAPERRHQNTSQEKRAAQGPRQEGSRQNQTQPAPGPFVFPCRECRLYYGLVSTNTTSQSRRSAIAVETSLRFNATVDPKTVNSAIATSSSQ